MEPSQVSRVDVSSSVCFHHPGSSPADALCDAEEVQSDVGCVRFFERAQKLLI